MKSLLLISLLALAVPTSRAAVLVGSTFEDSDTGIAGRQTVLTTHQSNLTPWYSAYSSGSTNLQVADDVDGLGKSLKLNKGYFGITNFALVDLQVGETLSISFDYRFALAPGTSGDALRVMLYNSGDATPIAADINSVSEVDYYTGYYFSLGAGSATSSSSQTFLRKRNSGNSGKLNSAGGLSQLASSTTGVDSQTSKHSVILSLTRGETSNFLSMKIDGVAIISATDASGVFTQFNNLAIQNQVGATGANLFLDNITLSVIPEPGSLSLSFLASGALLYAVRRSKRSLPK